MSKYALVVHCGGCMLNHREIQYRMRTATDQSIPFTNYGTIIALITGTLAAAFASSRRFMRCCDYITSER